ncbi:MAG: aldo/keto reductase [Firmicutes bacterium]|nr:aldo/keto reductase [Bacillota bacterium]
MKYRKDKYGNEISALGYGCMRFPQTLGKINKEKTEHQIMMAIDGGVNYFDTAYMYPGSESVLGEILEKNHVRNKVKIATKLPHYLIKSYEGLEKLFNEQLRRLRTDQIDYYLMHMLSDIQTWEKLKSLGIEEWLASKKESGIINQIGFSYHGNSDMFCKLVDAYDWDFCQIQYNYMDEHSQAGRKGLNHAHDKGLTVIIMEPLRGGKLVSHLPEDAKRIFASHPVKRTPAQWAFRWLWDQPEVTCVLSGMNSEEMVIDNMTTASGTNVGELTSEDKEMLQNVVDAINSKMKVGCTGCGYCLPCPANVDIPGTFAAYNRKFTESRLWGPIEYLINTAMRKDSTAASNCIGCGKCEKHCPQYIPIRQELKNAQKHLEGPIYKVFRKLLSIFDLF